MFIYKINSITATIVIKLTTTGDTGILAIAIILARTTSVNNTIPNNFPSNLATFIFLNLIIKYATITTIDIIIGFTYGLAISLILILAIVEIFKLSIFRLVSYFSFNLLTSSFFSSSVIDSTLILTESLKKSIVLTTKVLFLKTSLQIKFISFLFISFPITTFIASCC